MSTELNFDPTSAGVQTNPYPFYRRLRDEAPVYYIPKLEAYALSRYEDCKNAFLHPELYSAKDFIAQAFGDLDPVPEVPSIIAMDPPEHTPLRKLAGKHLPHRLRDPWNRKFNPLLTTSLTRSKNAERNSILLPILPPMYP